MTLIGTNYTMVSARAVSLVTAIFWSWAILSLTAFAGQQEKMDFDSVEVGTLIIAETDSLVEGLIDLITVNPEERDQCEKVEQLVSHFDTHREVWLEEFELPEKAVFEFTLVRIASRDEYDNPSAMKSYGVITVLSENMSGESDSLASVTYTNLLESCKS